MEQIMRKSKRTEYAEYLRVVTNTQEGQYPTMFLYGYIGQKADPYWNEDPEEDITDLAVVKAIRELESKHSRINIRINSPGGSVMHGDPIVTAIKNSSAEIHTYNDGVAASMANSIWMAGKFRHASLHSKNMIHNTSGMAWGNAQTMREMAEMLDKFDEADILCFCEATGMSEDEAKKQYYDYRDHWLTSRDLQKLGLITEIENYQVAEISNTRSVDWKRMLEDAARAIVIEPEPKQENEYEKEKWREEHLERLAFLIK